MFKKLLELVKLRKKEVSIPIPEPIPEPEPEVPFTAPYVPEKEYTKRTRILMRQAEREVGRTGEWKAHQVYARLQKEFPSVQHCDLRYEIEKVYQEEFKEN